jgi:NDP-sugar pyrophosphorylase family protein
MKNIDVVVLCGGKGERLQAVVKDRPKVMAEIHGRVFLDILIEHALSFGLRRFILCSGYRSEYIETYYQNRKKTFELVFSRESSPLGTGGAVKNAQKLIENDTFMVMNGDSFCRVNLNHFYDFHMARHSLLSIVAARIDNSEDFGSLSIDDSGKITAFQEKAGETKEFVNAGVYLFKKEILSLIPKGLKN